MTKNYYWNKDATKFQIDMHLSTLKAGIRYYTNRNQVSEKLNEELDSFKDFYGIS